jgi:hypothetical protein
MNVDLLKTSSMIKSKGSTDESQARPWWLPSFTGLFLGFFFFLLRFTPSLVPRPPIFQGLLGGLTFFVGYIIGHGGVVLWRYLELPEVPRPWRRAANVVLVLTCAIAAAICIPPAATWQDEVRARMNMASAEPSSLLQVILVAAVVAVLLMLLARFLVGGIRAASTIFYRWVPRRIAALLGAAIFAVLLVTVVNGTLVSATKPRSTAPKRWWTSPIRRAHRFRLRLRDRAVPALRSRGRILAEPASGSLQRDQGRRTSRRSLVGRRLSLYGSMPGSARPVHPRSRPGWRLPI